MRLSCRARALAIKCVQRMHERPRVVCSVGGNLQLSSRRVPQESRTSIMTEINRGTAQYQIDPKGEHAPGLSEGTGAYTIEVKLNASSGSEKWRRPRPDLVTSPGQLSTCSKYVGL
jgi:hypothetical protein